MEIRNKQSLKSGGKKEEELGDGPVVLAEDHEGCSLAEDGIKREEATRGDMSRR